MRSSSERQQLPRSGQQWGSGVGSTRLLEASGIVVGPVDVNAPITWGGLRIWQENDQLNFEIAMDLDFLSYEATRSGLTCWFGFCSGVA